MDLRDADGWTAFGWAAHLGQGEMVRMFLAEGVNPNIADGTGVSKFYIFIYICREIY